jgi:arginyl-tRNA--protein-N-Asp/Glu arginylyltransferase
MRPIPPPPRDFEMYIGRPDTSYIERDAGDPLEEIYEKGYLPYSGAAGLQDVFYMSRSARIILSRFALTSENRRIAKKFDSQFKTERITSSTFIPTEAFWSLCLGYFAHKHGERAMPRARLETILKSGLISTVVVYTNGLNPIAYVLEVEDGSIGHFWFSFYDLSYDKQSLGLWLMLDCIREAQARGVLYYYLGTVYGEKGFYKLNFEPLEWWDGKEWNPDIKLLKDRDRELP